MGILCFLFYEESYVPILLSWKAKKIRYETKNWAVRSKLDEHQFELKYVFRDFLMRPAHMREFSLKHGL
jgi:DHA1 family multidrug resistance protein-like MFS transporter